MRARRGSLAALCCWCALTLTGAACGIKKPVGVQMADASDAGMADGPAGADAGESECVRAAVQLPWSAGMSSGAHPGLEVVAGSDAIAVLNRQASRLDVRTYGLDGAFLATGSLAADTQLLAAPGGGFAAIARTDDGGDLVLATFDAALTSGSTALAVSATATERVLAAIDLATTTIVVTDERFINLVTGTSATWSAALGAAEAQTFKVGRVYGMAAQADKVLVAWGADMILGLVVMDASAHVLEHVLDDAYLGNFAGETTSAMPTADGLLLFDGNPVRMTQIDFALSRQELARNMQLLTFYRTVPRVAGVTLGGRPVGFWLSVFPSSDNSQDGTLHQLYGCALDLAAPAACAGTSLIATTDLGGYEIEAQPVAAAALPGGDAVAIVHTDAGDRTWLRIADLRCAQPRD